MNKKIGIWGLGLVGKAAISYFAQRNYSVQVMDKRAPNPEEEALLARYKIPFLDQKEHLARFWDHNDHVLASCGIDLRPFAAYKNKWLSELDIFGQECTTPIIAITGSVGKTTITALLSQLLAKAGKKVFTGGNIGVGLLDCIAQANEADLIVLEVSSFQLERSLTFAPALSIITNIHANHLDRHNSFEEYRDIKLTLLRTSENTKGIALLPYELIHCVRDDKREYSFFKSSLPTANDEAPCMNNWLYYLHNDKIFMNYQTSITSIVTSIIDIDDIICFSYPQNILIIAATLDLLDIPLSILKDHIQTLSIPEHRMEKVGTKNGITFYNDSKSTIPEATLAAVQQLGKKPIILLLGGISKGVDRSLLVAQLAAKVKMIICFGREADTLKSFCDVYHIQSTSCPTLDSAFEQALKSAQSEDQILLCPAGASYDLYKDYQERGKHFKQLFAAIH